MMPSHEKLISPYEPMINPRKMMAHAMMALLDVGLLRIV